MTQREEIINLMDFLDDTLDEREMQLLVSYIYAVSVRNLNDYSQDEVNTIRSIVSDWGEVLDDWIAFRRTQDNPFTLPFPV